MKINQTLLLIFAFLLSISCKSQVKYSENVLKDQSERIILQKKNKTLAKPLDNKVTVNDIIKKLDVQPLQYSASPDSSEYEHPGYVKTLILQFYSNNREFRYKMDNNIKLYNIYIKLKDSIHESHVIEINKKTKRYWDNDAILFFGKMEVKDVKIYDVENN